MQQQNQHKPDNPPNQNDEPQEPKLSKPKISSTYRIGSKTAPIEKGEPIEGGEDENNMIYYNSPEMDENKKQIYTFEPDLDFIKDHNNEFIFNKNLVDFEHEISDNKHNFTELHETNEDDKPLNNIIDKINLLDFNSANNNNEKDKLRASFNSSEAGSFSSNKMNFGNESLGNSPNRYDMNFGFQNINKDKDTQLSIFGLKEKKKEKFQ